MAECYKKMMSIWPLNYAMKCSYCNRLEWRNHKTPEEFNIEGCLRCRLIIGNDLLDDDNYDTQVRKKFYNYKVTGRYESN